VVAQGVDLALRRLADGLERALTVAGALGGKAVGAGAGGSMFFITPDDPGPVIAAARDTGATVLPLRWASAGVRAW